MTIINKLFSKKFADSGSPAYPVLKNDEAHERGPGAGRQGDRGRQGRSREGRAGLGRRRTRTRSTPGSSSSRLRSLVAAIALSAVAAPAAVAAPPSLRLGEQTLHRCADGARWWCGKLARPLDPARPQGRRIGVSFRWLPPRRPGAGHPALVAVEGGPGYPSTGSRVEYTGIYGPLLRERGLLLDGPARHRRQRADQVQRCRTTRASARGCRSRRWSPAARGRSRGATASPDLFATAYATARPGRADPGAAARAGRPVRRLVRDLLRAVVHRAPPGPAALGPARLLLSRARARPVVRVVGDGGAHALDAVCARDPSCPAGSAVGAPRRAARAAARRAADRDACAPPTAAAGACGSTIQALVDLVQDAGSEALVYRELDPAVRAALAGDAAPLARMVDESRRFVHGGGGDPAYYSNGLYWAVACADYPQLFSMRFTAPSGAPSCGARIASPPPGAFDPFTAREWVTVDNYTQPYMGCLDWPRPRRVEPAVPATPTAAARVDPAADRRRRPRLAHAAPRRARVRADAGRRTCGSWSCPTRRT